MFFFCFVFFVFFSLVILGDFFFNFFYSSYFWGRICFFFPYSSYFFGVFKGPLKFLFCCDFWCMFFFHSFLLLGKNIYFCLFFFPILHLFLGMFF